jgi:predicted RNA-binding protein YlqC (UPF0109 family)
LPKEGTYNINDQKRKAVDATIRDDGQTIEITIKYDDGSKEKFIERQGQM